jgi:hypothetical protein
MSAVESHVFGPETLDLMSHAIEFAETMLPSLHKNESIRQKMALAILEAVKGGETHVSKLGEIAAARAANVARGA